MGLGVLVKAGEHCREEYLKREDPVDVARHRDDRDDASSQSLSPDVGPIVAHNDGGSTLVGLRAPHGFEIYEAVLSGDVGDLRALADHADGVTVERV